MGAVRWGERLRTIQTQKRTKMGTQVLPAMTQNERKSARLGISLMSVRPSAQYEKPRLLKVLPAVKSDQNHLLLLCWRM